MRRTVSSLGATGLALLLPLIGCDGEAPQAGGAHSGPANAPSTSAPPNAHQGFLYARVTTIGGVVHQGRLRWGGDEELFWSDYFNGYKKENPWARFIPPEALTETRPVEILGFRIAEREEEVQLGRPFMTAFGDIERIEADGRDLRVVLKSGTVFELDRMNADDLGDGLRIWEDDGEVLDLGERRIHTVEFLPTPPQDALPARLHGTVRTLQGDFTGHIVWDRLKCVGTDELEGRTAEGPTAIRFDTIGSITRRGSDGATVTLRDGTKVELSGGRDLGEDNRGTQVHDPRYGRVLIPWEAFERADFGAGGTGPGFDDFTPGRALTGGVTTRDGRRLAGRLVYDLDESESTETLDAPSGGVTYTVPFGRVRSIELPVGDKDAQLPRIRLAGGETLRLERGGDLADGNLGVLVFGRDDASPELVPWAAIARIDFEPATDD